MSSSATSEKVEQLKRELLEMEAKRKDIEKKLIDHRCVLETNKVGTRDSLVDKDDFPRDDIDVYAVRNSRSHIVRLENDAKALFNEMQSKLEELHALTK